MTDAELSARVARECFGWVPSQHPKAKPGYISPGDNPEGLYTLEEIPEFSTDPRDAERVWGWLCSHLPRGSHIELCHYDDGSGGLSIVAPDKKRPFIFADVVEQTAWVTTEEMQAVKGRALCLAALEVANAQGSDTLR